MAPATMRRAPYKDFLQPALHRRFTSTASIILGIAFIQSLILANWHSLFWTFFPLGPAGIRASFLFLCGLAIIVLRIAQYHVGLRTSISGFQTFTQNAFKIQTFEAVVSYTLAAWLYSQTYLWAASGEMRWITTVGGNPKLNEKPIYFTTHFLVFGAVQGVLHIFRDDDRLLLGTVKLNDQDAAMNGKAPSLLSRLLKEAPDLAMIAVIQSVAIVVLNLILYSFALRSLAWRTGLLLFRPFYSLPKTNLVPVHLPFTIWVLGRCLFAGFMLLFMWLAGNKMFSMFLVRPPLKHGNPLTSESKDPNGSLLNGLKSKKLPIRCFAMWELALIARDFEIRRKAIYQDLDHKDGPMWLQVYSICLDVVKGIELRIDAYGKGPVPPPTNAVATVPDTQVSRIAKPPKDDPVFMSTPTKKTLRGEVEKVVGSVAISPGQSSRLSPLMQNRITAVKQTIEAIKHEATSTTNPDNFIQRWTQLFLNSFVGRPARRTSSRGLAATVLGTPFGEPSLYINAISSLTRLAVHSLAEDNYGNVQRDVSTIIRTFTAVTKKLEAFKANFPTHWTDVEGKECPEVDAILEALKEGLSQLLTSFGPYARDLRLTFADMRLAREAAGIPGKELSKPETRSIR